MLAKISLVYLALFSFSAFAETIPINAYPGIITIIGESHKRIESMRLIEELITQSLQKNQCLTLALEIDSSQQPVIDSVMTGEKPVNAIDIAFAIDHSDYREMISSLVEWKKHTPCLQVIAIDTGIDTKYNRDEWMALKLSELPKNRPIIALLGSLHTLKKVDWLVETGKPSVAEILVKNGYSVNSFPQEWLGECTVERQSRFVDASEPEALTILNDSLMSIINAKRHTSTINVVDGFIVWECDNLSRDNPPHSNH